jgi:hypothetical protein
MPEQTHQFLHQLQTRQQPPFSLADLPDFPYEEYNRNLTRYSEMERWYSGEILEETVSASEKEIELYPVKINPIRTAVQKHAYILFGEVEQSDRPLVFPRAIAPQGSDSGKKIAQETQDVLYQCWWENNGRSLQMENALISQIYGGCIFRLAYEIDDPLRTVPIRIELVHPKFFVGRPDPSDMWKLEEAWIVKPISWDDAKRYGVDQGEETEYWLIEHWTPSGMNFLVNDQPAMRAVDGEWVDLSGPNPFGVVPITYIPHMRSAGFYGDNLIDPLKGIVKELNLRVADFGDAISVDSHAYLGMRNVQGAPQVQQLAPGLFVINLQAAPSITGNESPPDIFELRKPAASAPMAALVEELYKEYRREAFIPNVADGEDEGSQRSGLTLATRFWPLLAHTNTERIYWTAGLDRLNRMILRMLMVKGDNGITVAHATMRLKEDWSPALPRDREVTVNEAVARITAKLGSPEHMLEILGDVDDIDEEVKLILEFQKKVAKIQAEAAPTPFGGPKGVSGGAGKEKPVKPTGSEPPEKSKRT